MQKEKGIKKTDLSREEFLKHAWEWKNKYGGIILKQLEKLGASCDWDRTRFTMENDLSEAVIDVFIDQNKYFGYPFNEIDKYFNSGVIFSKDCIEANDFFSLWHENYKNGLLKGVYQDQPSFSKTIYESKFNIQELNGEWNCQSRLGAKYLRNLKILHFVSKRNMPISLLDNKNFLLKLRREGLTSENKETVKNYESAFYSPMGIVVNDDLHFNFSPLYEEVRKFYVSTNTPYLFNIQEIHNNLYEKSIKSRMAKIFYKINKALFQIEVILIRSFSKPIEGE